MIGESKFSTSNHLKVLREEMCDRKKIRDEANDAKLGGLVDNLEALDRRLILSTKHMVSV